MPIVSCHPTPVPRLDAHPHPDAVRHLAAAVLLQAVKDLRARDARVQHEAVLFWSSATDTDAVLFWCEVLGVSPDALRRAVAGRMPPTYQLALFADAPEKDQRHGDA